MTRHLSLAAPRLLADNYLKKSAHITMLRKLRNFCDGDTPESDDAEQSDSYGFFRLYRAQGLRYRSFGDLDFQENAELRPGDEPDLPPEPYITTLNFDIPGDAESVLTAAGVDDGLTPLEQEREARGILLGTAEDHQFLPFSWNRPSAVEQTRLDAWIKGTLSAQNRELAPLAAFVSIAIQTSNSLETVRPTALSKVSGPDWSIDVARGSIHRLSPRRYQGWRVTEASSAWVEPLTEILTLALQPEIADILRQSLAAAPNSTQLGHLWPASALYSPATFFAHTCRDTPGLERLRSGMLAKALTQQVFAATADPVLSELLSSHPRTGLGGACAYAAFRHDKVHTLLTGISQVQTPTAESTSTNDYNAAGSELSPLESVLRKACAEALEKVSELAAIGDQWADHHNAVTAYMVTVLLAATGARPISSPFERLAHFDLDTGSLYVVDKVSSRLHQGRLVPLPPPVVNLIRGYYLPHLKTLSVLVSQIDPVFSEVLKTIADNGASDDLPLFFLLTSNPKLRWLEVSETSLSALGIFSWPLPWNLMRHRLPTALKRMGADHESISGITGHGESGTAPYGAYSMRIWNDDAASLRPALGELLSRLELRTPETPTGPGTPIANQTPDKSSSCIQQTREFGSLAREKQRTDRHEQAREIAEKEIVAFVTGRPIDSLSAQDWETLSQSMLLHKDHRPRTLASIRYDTLQQWISRHWQEKGLRPRIKRRYLPALEEQSPFSAQVIGCQKQIKTALEISSQIVSSQVLSRTSLRESLALGITMLILESRLADTSVIDDLLQNRNYRLVIFQRDYFLEHSPGLDKVPDAPCRRFTISPGVFKLLAKVLQAKVNLDLRARLLTQSLRKIGKHIPGLAQSEKLGSYLHAMCDVVRQTNNLQYPGAVAAYLNRDIVTAALRHVDWVRITLGKALDFNSDKQLESDAVAANPDEDDDYAPPPETIDAAFVHSSNPFTQPKNVGEKSAVKLLQDACFDFFKDTRDALNDELCKKSPDRQNLDSELRKLKVKYKGQVSRSCLLLADWQRSLLWRKSPKGYLSLRSILRYFNALSVCFQAMAYAHDLTSCEEEDVTEFYRQIMEIRRLVRPGKSSKKTSNPKLEEENADDVDDADGKEERSATWYRSQQLAFQLLKDFHRFVHREFAIEDPDWSEIGAAEGLLSISPGTLTESEYLCALCVLTPEPRLATREQLARAFILLVAFRFGLRGAEITGMLRSDWVDDAVDALVVLVRDNKWRGLKTRAGQRQVPLLFLFTDHEKEVIARWMDSWEGLTATTRRTPLFADTQAPDELMDSLKLRREVSEVIKQVTGNPALSLHHARHAFANDVALLLMDKTEGLWPFALSECQTTPERRSHVRRLLLVTEGVTRRTLWVLARLLGHAHPHTGVRSYLHLLPELAARYVNLPSTRLSSAVDTQDSCINLDRLVDLAGYLEPAPAEQMKIAAPVLTAERALHFLQLCQRGIALPRAQSIVGVSKAAADLLLSAMKILDEVMAKRPHVNLAHTGDINFLTHIPSARWAVLRIKASAVKWPKADERREAILVHNIAQIIGPTRQVVLWKPHHFHFFSQVVTAWQLSNASYRFICSSSSKEALIATSEKAELTPNIKSKLQLELNSKAPQQIDQIYSGDEAMQVKHRCAVITETDINSDLRSSFELVLITVISVAILEASAISF